MNKSVVASVAVMALSIVGAGSNAMAAPPVLKLICSAGQTIAFDGTNWDCADFPAISGLERVQVDFPANDGSLSTTATQEVFAACPTGKKVVGGGYLHFYGGSTGVIRNSAPTINSDGWIVDGTNFDGTSWRLSAVAMCADAD
ncbi:MAG TPA: hypothetical protein VFG52_03025 [Xanthomonadales bacterium]|nr:hypothetical protein [Xanthomonadales bacterium]